MKAIAAADSAAGRSADSKLRPRTAEQTALCKYVSSALRNPTGKKGWLQAQYKNSKPLDETFPHLLVSFVFSSFWIYDMVRIKLSQQVRHSQILQLAWKSLHREWVGEAGYVRRIFTRSECFRDNSSTLATLRQKRVCCGICGMFLLLGAVGLGLGLVLMPWVNVPSLGME